MKHTLSQRNLFILLSLIILGCTVLFYFTFTSNKIWNIDTDGFTHTIKDPIYLQPWVWASVLSLVVMVVFFVTQGGDPNKMEPDSEEGTTHE